MNRIPKWAVIASGILLFLFALMGVTNSEHAIAKVVYATLIIASLAIITIGLRRPFVTTARRESSPPETKQ